MSLCLSVALADPPDRITDCPLADRSQDKIETSRYYDVVDFGRRVPRRLRGVAGR